MGQKHNSATPLLGCLEINKRVSSTITVNLHTPLLAQQAVPARFPKKHTERQPTA